MEVNVCECMCVWVCFFVCATERKAEEYHIPSSGSQLWRCMRCYHGLSQRLQCKPCCQCCRCFCRAAWEQPPPGVSQWGGGWRGRGSQWTGQGEHKYTSAGAFLLCLIRSQTLLVQFAARPPVRGFVSLHPQASSSCNHFLFLYFLVCWKSQTNSFIHYCLTKQTSEGSTSDLINKLICSLNWLIILSPFVKSG